MDGFASLAMTAANSMRAQQQKPRQSSRLGGHAQRATSGVNHIGNFLIFSF
jgi:hypothetical protein